MYLLAESSPRRPQCWPPSAHARQALRAVRLSRRSTPWLRTLVAVAESSHAPCWLPSAYARKARRVAFRRPPVAPPWPRCRARSQRWEPARCVALSTGRSLVVTPSASATQRWQPVRRAAICAGRARSPRRCLRWPHAHSPSHRILQISNPPLLPEEHAECRRLGRRRAGEGRRGRAR
jgi:hypothetical protein